MKLDLSTLDRVGLAEPVEYWLLVLVGGPKSRKWAISWSFFQTPFWLFYRYNQTYSNQGGDVDSVGSPLIKFLWV